MALRRLCEGAGPLVALLVLAGTAGSAPALGPGSHSLRVRWQDVERRVLVHVPQAYDGSRALPLLLDLHALGSRPERQISLSGFRELAEDAGFMVAYPAGRFGSWNAGDLCCGRARALGVDDVGFLRAVLARIAGELRVDRRRVYATGLSNGAAMVQRLACDAADVFAAVAAVAFPLPFRDPSRCRPSRPIAVLSFRGRTDRVVPYNGGAGLLGAEQDFAHWRDLDGCGTEALPEPDGSAGCRLDRSCRAAVEVGLCSVRAVDRGRGHVLYLNDELVISERAWRFLSRFTLPDPSP